MTTPSLVDTLIERNRAFARARFDAALKIVPSRKTMILGCVDPRVDPVEVLGVGLGEAAVIRNVGGRVTPDVIDTMTMLRVVAHAGGGDLGNGWNLIVLHHTDCGITRLGKRPELLAKLFGVPAGDLPALAVDDPRASLAVDVAALVANPAFPRGFVVSGLLYDVATGLTEVVVPPAQL